VVDRHAVRPAARLAALAALALAAPARAEERGGAPVALPNLFLATLPVMESAPGTLPDAPLRATLVLNPAGAAKVPSLREWFPGARAEGDRLTVVLAGRAPRARASVSAAHRHASFVVDFDEPAVAALREEVARRFGARPGDEDLARFVDGFIERKGLSASLDIASTVAAKRAGDCSEHAVLLAALARLEGRAARVVLGIALVPLDDGLHALGHAWTEVHDGRRWNTLDASPLPPGVRYLPLSVLADEGPGYLAAVWGRLSPLDVRGVALAPAR
jgi:transglutaminase-like putative cysteine protease